MTTTTAIGIGILAAGAALMVTSRGSTVASTRDALVKVLTRSLAYVAVGGVVGFLVSSLDDGAARIVTLVVGLALVGLAVLRAVGRQPRPRQVAILGVVFGVSALMGLVVNSVFGEVAAIAATSQDVDATGDCVCDAGLDIVSIGYADDRLVIETADRIPAEATFWIWSSDRPLSPIEVARLGESWQVAGDTRSADPAGVLLVADGARLELHLGRDVGPFAVTTSGDRAPDTGYHGPESGSSDTVVRFQSAYPDLSDGGRILAAAFLANPIGEYRYAVGISADPGVEHSGTLRVQDDGTVEFALEASETWGGHVDRFGDAESCQNDTTSGCEPMWSDPFRGLDDLLSGLVPSITRIEGRVVMGREATCVAVEDPASSSLHRGEVCVFADGAIAFVDDRTAGYIAVLTEASNA